MQKPLDPMSVETTETPSASVVLRRRYGPARHIIAFASWVTVISMLLQPVAVLAGTWSSINWSSDSVLPLSSSIEYTAAVDFKTSTTYGYATIGGVSFQQSPGTTPYGPQNYAPLGPTLGTWQLVSSWSSIGASSPSGTESDKLRDLTLYGTATGKQITFGGLTADTDYIFSFYAPKYDTDATRGVTLTADSVSSGDIKQGDGADIIRYA